MMLHHRRLHPLLLFLVCNLCTSALDAPNPIARYSFETESCDEESQSFADTAEKAIPPLPPFVRDPMVTQCSKGLGIESLATTDSFSAPDTLPLSLEKSGTQDILQLVQESKQGISFEFWLKPIGDLEHRPRISKFSIFTFGLRDLVNKADESVNDCDEEHFDFRLQEYNRSLQVAFRTESLFGNICPFILDEYPTQPGKLLHLVAALSEDGYAVYVDGKVISDGWEPFSDDIQPWSEESMMSFFSALAPTRREALWPGRLYQFAVYDRKLSKEEVKMSLRKGLPRGKPFSLPYRVKLNEDGEALPGSHPQDWYTSSPIPKSQNSTDGQDIQTTMLKTFWVQDEVESLLASESANLEPAWERNETSFVYVTGLPSRGSLYRFLQGKYIQLNHSSDKPFFMLIEDPSSMIFLPAFNEYSSELGTEYARISYCVVDHKIFDPAQCESTPISIIVEPVNDPPIAFASPQWIDVLEGQVEPESTTSITLGGIDVDKQDTITTIQITSPPTWGTLILRVTSFREDGVPHGTSLTLVNNFTISSQENSIRVKYLFDRFGSAPGLFVPGNDARDYFRFRVSDSSGVWSIEETVQVNLLSAVATDQSEATQRLPGERTSNLSLSASDSSGYARPLAYLIASLPDTRFGSLRDARTNKNVKVGSVVVGGEAGGSNQSALLSFQPWSGFCDSTSQTEIESFSYRAVALVGDTVASASPTKAQELELRCESRPIELTMTNNFLNLEAFGLRSMNDTSCGDNFYESLSSSGQSSCFAIANVTGIQVNMPSQHFRDPVTVTVTVLTGKGFISFTKESWNKVKSIQGRRTMASGNVTFNASSSELDAIFAGLSFRSQARGSDALEILTEHGTCNNFDNTTTKAAGSCHRANFAVTVHVIDGEPDPVYEPAVLPFPKNTLWIWFGYPLAYFVMKYCGLCDLKCSSRRAAKDKHEHVKGHGLDKSTDNLPDTRNDVQVEACGRLGEASHSPYGLDGSNWYEFFDENGDRFYQNIRDRRGLTWLAPDRFIPYVDHDMPPVFEVFDAGSAYYVRVDRHGNQHRSEHTPQGDYFHYDAHEMTDREMEMEP